ncbi:hypothetical protein WOLCODRAFT_161975 [Wolfiporia cocos MD-104 SS10]|uniref:Uncharacterized protein n=1 Tax=Wolfiporia cocos (strain MD-104) TaxID=742152 RepID=A0A2H3JJ88_WOLCO|nr:hypothetical protein WOLCODRAFT_161975 [Wolfiporia cocos MD-104 SS10]
MTTTVGPRKLPTSRTSIFSRLSIARSSPSEASLSDVTSVRLSGSPASSVVDLPAVQDGTASRGSVNGRNDRSRLHARESRSSSESKESIGTKGVPNGRAVPNGTAARTNGVAHVVKPSEGFQRRKADGNPAPYSTRIRDLESALSASRTDTESTQTALRASEDARAALEEQLASVQSQLSDAEATIAEGRDAYTTLEARVELLETGLQERAATGRRMAWLHVRMLVLLKRLYDGRVNERAQWAALSQELNDAKATINGQDALVTTLRSRISSAEAETQNAQALQLSLQDTLDATSAKYEHADAARLDAEARLREAETQCQELDAQVSAKSTALQDVAARLDGLTTAFAQAQEESYSAIASAEERALEVEESARATLALIKRAVERAEQVVKPDAATDTNSDVYLRVDKTSGGQSDFLILATASWESGANAEARDLQHPLADRIDMLTTWINSLRKHADDQSARVVELEQHISSVTQPTTDTSSQEELEALRARISAAERERKQAIAQTLRLAEAASEADGEAISCREELMSLRTEYDLLRRHFEQLRREINTRWRTKANAGCGVQ